MSDPMTGPVAAPAAEPELREYLTAMLRWHFGEETGSRFWVDHRSALPFDPVADIRTFDDLRRFPSRVNELREARVEDLVPRGLADEPPPYVVESGGTTGRPKRAVLSLSRIEQLVDLYCAYVPEAAGHTMLSLFPTGPHLAGNWQRRWARRLRVPYLQVDIDPRWVKSGIGADVRRRYVEHVLAQALDVLRTQHVGHLLVTPPLLRALARSEELADRVRATVRVVTWGGARMTREEVYEYARLVFPDALFVATYASSITGTRALLRRTTAYDDHPVFDPAGPELFVRVVDPGTRGPVPYGARGQVLMHTVTRDMFLPNNLERDLAVRTAGTGGEEWRGDSVADVVPMAEFEGSRIVEGIY
ncbi:phenazine antibiotic biosynthesis protein [Streptomyces sp. NPDC092952]|uniref:phenazine antibiotic biosynthesis protein n=1 Tax=Streptomyces sp. NPDC092952 TaxID=3366018 RepID=UPI00381D56E4